MKNTLTLLATFLFALSSLPIFANTECLSIENQDRTLKFYAKNKYLKKGEVYEIPIFAENFDNILGGQFTFHFDIEVLDFQEIRPKSDLLDNGNFGTRFLDQGAITFSWSEATGKDLAKDQAFFELKFKAKENGWLQDLITINSKVTPAEAYVEKPDDIYMYQVKLEVKDDPTDGIAASPNPFSEFTKISFTTEINGRVVMDIFDTSGKRVKTFSEKRNAGAQSFLVNKKDLPAKGIYFFEIKTKQKTFSGKIVFQ